MAQLDAAVIVAALERDYPLPRLDPEWVANCLTQIDTKEAQDRRDVIEAVRECYLNSDLATSTLQSVTLPTTSTHNTTTFQTATLLQVESITEIGSSAFQLQSILDQRRDVFQGFGKIKRMPDPTDGEDLEDEDDEDLDKLPPYPRGMLRFVVGDGRGRCKAVEFKKVQGFRLGETALGSKILVQNVKVLHGMLLLTPANTQVLHHSIPELQATQARRFVASLRERMGKEPLSDEEEEEVQVVPAPPTTVTRPVAQPQTDAARAARRRAILGQKATPPPSTTAQEEDQDSPPKLLSRFFALRGQPTQPPERQQDSDTFSDFDVDEGIIAQIDAVERQTRLPPTTSGRGGGGGQVKRRKPSPEIIEISSD